MIAAMIQARMGSKRLPGKVLMEICGQSILELLVERLQQAAAIDKLLVVTSTEAADDKIVVICNEKGIMYYRGSQHDVLDRFYQAACHLGLQQNDAIVRITADCPLLDSEIVDQTVCLFQEAKVDYASNDDPPSFPDGLDVEIFKFTALEQSWREAQLPSEREHVTPYIRQHPELFSRANLHSRVDLSQLRWTVDELEDYELVKIIFENLYPIHPNFKTKEILDFLDKNPVLRRTNQRFTRNQGYQTSLQEDGLFELKAR